MMYHVTMTCGRSDSFHIEVTDYQSLLQVLDAVSVANVDSIKEVVYSKDLAINYIHKTYEEQNNLAFLCFIVKSLKNTKVYQIPFPKQSLNLEKTIKVIKENLLLLGDPILEILNLKVIEGFARKQEG